MGIGGISIWQLLIVLGIIILIFGTKKLRNLGGDLGGAVKGFKKAMSDGEKESEKEEASSSQHKEQLNKKMADDDDVIDVRPEKAREQERK